ncbi:potassium-transporting ATPase subunit KdpA [Bifidobacterium pullorum subsp. saeculare]|uniref:Potassium-transporting ATPase subunit KdpA n=1 Tax=Bifidobacterium pullorum subsp. saeculare TaxID=78257 RepID=A0A939BA96_9BIFI|nr:potassium-transporting ATPase subunit KdpA [Bifidobacterium pullorum subsp. saeculare]
MVYIYAILAFALVAAILAAIYKPLGDYMYNVFTSDKDLFFEKWIYKIIGVDSKKEQTWKAYLRGILAFSLLSVLVLYLLQRVQQWLPYSLGMKNVSPALAFNTAASFVTNTN